jgi:hypothetical protein
MFSPSPSLRRAWDPCIDLKGGGGHVRRVCLSTCWLNLHHTAAAMFHKAGSDGGVIRCLHQVSASDS